MIKYHNNIQQGTPEWHALRCGVVTASKVGALVTPKTLKVAKNEAVRSMAYDIAAQRITGHTEPSISTYHMQRGHLEESIAREVYSDRYYPVQQTGFVTRQIDSLHIGYSPDGLVGNDGLIEIKSRVAKYQAQTIALNSVPREYSLQLQMGLLVTNRKWIDFVSYSNGMPLYVERVYQSTDVRDTIISAVAYFEGLVKAIMEDYEMVASGLVQTERYEELEDEEIYA